MLSYAVTKSNLSRSAAAARACVGASLALVLAALGGGAARADSDVVIAGVPVHVRYPAGAYAREPDVLAWVRRSGAIVAAYYGRFPAATLTLELEPVAGGGVHGGQTFGQPAPFIRVRLGREADAAQLMDDWVLVHEMTHLALPDTGERHAWLSEGVATYVEGVARVQAGNRSEADMWGEELRAMPRGLPGPQDEGLDRTHTWGRTYWGGAMFCLLADVEIRRRTGNAKGLQDALRAVLVASGGLHSDWPIERVFATGDAAVGVPVLAELYARYADKPATPDLKGLWKELGVTADGEGVRLDDSAPLAPVRRAILTPER